MTVKKLDNYSYAQHHIELLEHQLASIVKSIDALSYDLREFRSDSKREAANLRDEFKQEARELRNEMKQNFKFTMAAILGIYAAIGGMGLTAIAKTLGWL